jgi:integrase
MARKRILPRYVQWRDGRPRWELGGDGGKRLRAAGFRSIDLKDAAGNWLSFEQAKIAGTKLNTAVDQWRDRPGGPSQAELEAMVQALPAPQRGFAGDFAYLARGPSGKARLIGELVDAHRKSKHWRQDVSAGTRRVYLSRGNVLKLWLGDVAPDQVQKSAARRWFEMMLDAGFAQDQAPAGHKGQGLDWHLKVRDMSRAQKEDLRARRESAMENDADLAANPPGYTTAFYILSYARGLIAWANREEDMALANPFEKLNLASPGGRIRYAEAEEIGHMVATALAMNRPALADAVALALGTVQRRSDVLQLTWKIRTEGRFSLTQQKTGAVVGASLPKSTQGWLDAAWSRTAAAGLLPLPDAPILPYAKPDALTAEWSVVRAEAARTMPSLADLLFHDLRDTAFTRLIESGSDLIAACQVSGHSIKQATTIEKAYLSHRFEIADRAITRIDDWMQAGGVKL